LDVKCISGFSVSSQGFIEMEDKETASTFLNYYSHVTPTIRYSKAWLWGFSVNDLLDSIKRPADNASDISVR